MKGGPNGLFVVLLALGWWCHAVIIHEQSLDGCERALSDVQWTLNQMKGSLSDSRKREREGQIAPKSSKK